MRKIEINTICKKLLADVYTPVGIYLRVRDRFRDTILLESTDHHAAENSWSFICINAIGGIEITSLESIEFKLPKQNPERVAIRNVTEVPGLLWDFMQNFEAPTNLPQRGRPSQPPNMRRVCMVIPLMTLFNSSTRSNSPPTPLQRRGASRNSLNAVSALSICHCRQPFQR